MFLTLQHIIKPAVVNSAVNVSESLLHHLSSFIIITISIYHLLSLEVHYAPV